MNQLIVSLSSFAALFVTFFIYLSRAVKPFLYNKGTLFLFLAIAMLAFGVVALLTFSSLNEETMLLFTIMQFTFLVFGVLHVIAMYGSFEWTSIKSFFPEFVFTLLTASAGAASFILVLNFVTKYPFSFQMYWALLSFIIPFLVVKTYHFAIAIPAAKVKKWFYPLFDKPEDPRPGELANPVVMAFELPKTLNDERMTSFRAKAPRNMPMGELFYHFINDYNEKNKNTPIEFTDLRGNPQGWVFYFKPGWLGFMKYINPQLTVAENNIRENSIIICMPAADETGS